VETRCTSCLGKATGWLTPAVPNALRAAPQNFASRALPPTNSVSDTATSITTTESRIRPVGNPPIAPLPLSRSGSFRSRNNYDLEVGGIILRIDFRQMVGDDSRVCRRLCPGDARLQLPQQKPARRESPISRRASANWRLGDQHVRLIPGKARGHDSD
jgi:hypothetical protein